MWCDKDSVWHSVEVPLTITTYALSMPPSLPKSFSLCGRKVGEYALLPYLRGIVSYGGIGDPVAGDSTGWYFAPIGDKI